MSLDKAIEHGKEKRKPYTGSKSFDRTCRNHGSCPWCRENRTHRFRDKENDAMRVEITYIADDDTEFDTKEECEAYEAAQRASFDSVLMFDDDFNLLTEPSENTFESAWYIFVRNGEQADELFRWQYDTFGICMDGLPEHLNDGDIFAWDCDDGEWYSPVERHYKYKRVWDAIVKAVSAVG